jgi:hypothetical protein
MSIYPGSRPSQLVAVSWSDRLDAARNENELLEVARDFLATFSPYDLARLPESMRPGRLVDANDVSELAFILLSRGAHDVKGSPRGLHRLRRFFTHASVRVSELMAAPSRREVIPPPRSASAADRAARS